MKLLQKQWCIYTIALFSLLNTNLFSQKQDYMWLSGYDSHVGYDTSWGFYFGTSVLDFNNTPLDIRYDSLKMNFDKSNTSYCDSNGKLLFYTNGIEIRNSLDELVANGWYLNTGYVTNEWDPNMQIYGYRNPQGILAFAHPNHSGNYFLLHSYMDSISNTGLLYCKKILLTTLDLNANGGHGVVTSKNQEILQGNFGLCLSACRHANGRDWWALAQKTYTNCYNRILIDEAGIHPQQDTTCGGGEVPFIYSRATVFSPDGTKYVHYDIKTGLNIFDFDRCSGMLSNAVTIPMPNYLDSGYINAGAAISPNSRFLYVGCFIYVFQFDLQAADIAASIDTVAVYDGFASPFASFFHTMQLAPDGKIYESCGNGETVYHVIDRPDEKGDSCLFKQHAIQLLSPSAGVPNFPNYRLGALTGSPCDTLTGLNDIERAEKEKILKVFPNPATDFITIDYGFTDWSKGDIELEIVNELGHIVYLQKLPMYSGFQKINVSLFASGVYNVFIKRGAAVSPLSSWRGAGGEVIANAKFVKQ